MKVEVKVTESFVRAAKPLLKRYRSFPDDLAGLERLLLKEPMAGTPLGGNVFKIRLKITSKGKGKSGGARVITIVALRLEFAAKKESVTEVSLLTVYDRSDQSTISDSELKKLIAAQDLDD